MDTQSEFERQITERVDKIESEILALSRKIDGLSFAQSPRPSYQASASPSPQPAVAPKPRPAPKPHSLAPEPSTERGVEWWLSRAGAGLTIIAVILLYQYAVGHGWITPWVRVLAGASIGGALMYWGRKMAPAALDDPRPVALRELMMGSALAVWYITAYAASARYHLVPLSASRYVFLVLSIGGGALSLKERRSTMALIAVSAGFLGPMILGGSEPSPTAYALYLAILAAMAIVLFLMRGWQSVLWISFFEVSTSLSRPVFYSDRVVMTLMALAVAAAYVRAPTLRRGLVATGADRYTEPVRSLFAMNWLDETARFLRMFSPVARSRDSLSLWVITLAAPLAGISLLSRAWPTVSVAVWGAIEIVLAGIAYLMCRSAEDENRELTHVLGVASLAWGNLGVIGVAHGLVSVTVIDHATIALAAGALTAILAIELLDQPRFIAAVAVGRLMAAVAVLAALFSEFTFLNLPVSLRQVDHIRVALSIAELMAIGAGAIAWRDMRRRSIGAEATNALAVMCYGALLLLDARIFGEVWKPLVTASFAVAGTALIFMSRKEDNKILRVVGGATLGLVMLRLFFVDMNGVDTIWRVLLFLGIGALFLFTSRQLQLGRKQAPAESS